MMGVSTYSIKRFLEDTVFIFLEIRVANWRSYYSDLIVWEGGFAECVLEKSPFCRMCFSTTALAVSRHRELYFRSGS